MQATDINENSVLLKGLLHKSLVDTTTFISEKCSRLSAKPQEPDFIAGLTLKFSVDLFNILKTLFSKHKFSVTAIYCHQKPIVDIGLGKNPELGDLLLVYIYTDKSGQKRYNSLLLQVKISRETTIRLSAGERHQFELYNKWPRFTYARAGKLNGEQRDILPKTFNDGGQYLLIDTDPVYGLSGLPGTFPMGCALAAEPVELDSDFADELIDFLKFKSGRTFEKDPFAADDWTKMIWDLLALSLISATRRKNAGIANFPRQVTKNFDGCCVFSATASSIFKDLQQYLGSSGGHPGGAEYNEEINPGVSVILIESAEINEEIVPE